MTIRSAPPPALSLRERGKRKTYASILDAAWALFVEKGFDGATTREIADRAGVAVGTVFIHASDKDELLLMAYLDRARRAFERGFERATEDLPVIEREVSAFESLFDEFSSQPALALKCLCAALSARGRAAEAFAQLEQRFAEQLEALLEAARARGEVREDLDARAYARNLTAIYRDLLFRWLASESSRDPSAARTLLVESFTVAHGGARPRAKKRATAPELDERASIPPPDGARPSRRPR